jgi:GNAT superfamily N-acetyltransferase
MNVTMRQAAPEDVQAVSAILHEAAHWLEQIGQPMWRSGELSETNLAREIDQFYLAEVDQKSIGTLKFQMEDSLFGPDHPEPDTAYVHRIALRRSFAGQGICHAMISWAARHAHLLGKKYLRLDCEATRPRLRAVYETFGFAHHSDMRMGPYLVARYEYKIPAS